ncbi:MAG: phosphoribosyltransferase, partial [Pseudomonadales bacterium]
MSNKVFISAQQLLEDATNLGQQILASDFRPNFIVGVWRGGTPVGIAVQELLDFYGVETDHIAIRTSSYQGMRRAETPVRVHGLSYL